MSARRAIARAASFAALGLLALVLAASAAAGPGGLLFHERVNFANGSTPVDGFSTGISVRPDGRIVQAGQVFNGGYFDFHVVQYNPDGAFDTTFGSGGAAFANFGGDATVGGSFLQPDGKLLVVGSAKNGAVNDLAIARFQSNGLLDPTFNGDGKLLMPIGIGNDSGESIAFQGGKIVAVGDIQNGSNLSGFILGLNADGSHDSAFNGGVPLITTLGQPKASFAKVLLIPGNPTFDILVVGGAQTSTNFDFLAARYTSAGTLDPLFGDGGKLFTDFGGGDAARDVVFDAAGNAYYVFGSTFNGTRGFFATERLTSSGQLDPLFGSGGKVITNMGIDVLAGAAVLQPDGKLIGVGSVDTGTNFDFGLFRLKTNGALDPIFGNGGTVTTDFSGGNDDPEGAALQPDGNLVVGGSSLNLTTGKFGFGWGRYDLTNPPPPPPPPPKYPLTAAVQPSGGGTVTTEPDPKVNCPPTCTATYDAGTNVGLRATAAPGYRFVRWQDDCSGTVKTCSVVMNGPRKVTAVFEYALPCKCVALEANPSGAYEGKHSPFAGKAIIGFRLNWRIHCSRGLGEACKGKLKLVLPAGTDLKLETPDSRTVTCSGACNQSSGHVTAGGSMKVQVTSTNDLDPKNADGKTFTIKVKRYCLVDGKKVLVGVSSVSVAFRSGRHSRISIRD